MITYRKEFILMRTRLEKTAKTLVKSRSMLQSLDVEFPKDQDCSAGSASEWWPNPALPQPFLPVHLLHLEPLEPLEL